MKTYYLKHKTSNEIISKSVFESLSSAIEYFSKRKCLNKKEFLRIFIVTDSGLK